MVYVSTQWGWTYFSFCRKRFIPRLFLHFPKLCDPNFLFSMEIAHLCSVYTGWPKKNGTVNFFGLCSDQQLSFFTLLDRASFPHYKNTKIIKFGWELFILWVISYGLSFSGFAINLSLIVPRNSGNRANPENDSPSEITHKIKSSQPNLMILVLL